MENIVLKPKLIFWMIKYFFSLMLGIIIFLIAICYRDILVVKYICGTAALMGSIFLFYKYIDMLICTEWVITQEQIKISKGVFNKTTNYLELYRVYDYEEKRSFIQNACNNMTLFIHSGDKSHPTLVLYGLKKNDFLLSDIRGRVEKQRAIKGIYEFTNR